MFINRLYLACGSCVDPGALIGTSILILYILLFIRIRFSGVRFSEVVVPKGPVLWSEFKEQSGHTSYSLMECPGASHNTTGIIML